MEIDTEASDNLIRGWICRTYGATVSSVMSLVGLVLGSTLMLASDEATATTRSGSPRPTLSVVPTEGAASIEVEVETSIANADTVRGWVEERAARAIRDLERGLEPEDVIRIVVRGGAYDYRISLVLLRHGSALAPDRQPSEFECACGSDDMLEMVAVAISEGARTLGEAADRERKEAAERWREEDELRRQETERQRPSLDGTARYRPGPVGRAGIGVVGTGAILAASGIIMALQPPQRVNGLQAVARDWSNPGYVVLGIGATAIVGGLTVLIVDVVRCRRGRSRCQAPTMAWATETRRGGAR